MHPDIYEQMAAVEQRHWWFVGRRTIIKRVIESLALPHNSNVLELGCGTGGNLATLARFGQVSAVEMNPNAVAHVRAQGWQVHQGWLPDGLPEYPHGFDLIVMLDVLEHIEDDRASLDVVRNLLRTGGYLLLTVPAFQFLWSPHDELLQHKRRYRRAKLVQLLTDCDYRIARTSYFNSLLLPVAATVRLAQRWLGLHSRDSGLHVPVTVVNSALTRLFEAEVPWIMGSGIPAGLSLMVLSQRV